jgi:hypothetical protein
MLALTDADFKSSRRFPLRESTRPNDRERVPAVEGLVALRRGPVKLLNTDWLSRHALVRGAGGQPVPRSDLSPSATRVARRVPG